MSGESQNQEAEAVSVESLQAKIKEQEQDILRLEKAKIDMTARTLKVYEENAMIKASSEVAVKQAQFDYDMKLAATFVESGALPKGTNGAQVYMMMKVGKAMGLSDFEAITGLYFVNGKLDVYGKTMVAVLRKNGYDVEYIDEDPGNTVTVLVSRGDEIYREVATRTDAVLTRSKAMGFAPQHKLRYHGVRMILNFYLPHLLGGVSDYGSVHYEEPKAKSLDEKAEDKERQRILDHIKESANVETLAQVRDHVSRYDLGAEYEDRYLELTN